MAPARICWARSSGSSLLARLLSLAFNRRGFFGSFLHDLVIRAFFVVATCGAFLSTRIGNRKDPLTPSSLGATNEQMPNKGRLPAFRSRESRWRGETTRGIRRAHGEQTQSRIRTMSGARRPGRRSYLSVQGNHINLCNRSKGKDSKWKPSESRFISRVHDEARRFIQRSKGFRRRSTDSKMKGCIRKLYNVIGFQPPKGEGGALSLRSAKTPLVLRLSKSPRGSTWATVARSRATDR